MRILIGTHHMLDFTGSEIFTYELVKLLVSRNYQITVYSKFWGVWKKPLEKLGVKCTDNLPLIKKDKFDIAHIHHNITTYEVRYHFPELPIVFMNHGAIPFLEQPPIIDIGISHYLAISEKGIERLHSLGIPRKMISLCRNLFNIELFSTNRTTSEVPKKALIISSRLDLKREMVIKKALEKLNITYKFIGGRFGSVNNNEISRLIKQADIVFSLGRGAVEAMLAGRVPIIYDYQGGDGLVTPENCSILIQKNFSGRTYQKEYSVNGLIKEIRKYKQEYGLALQKLAVCEYGEGRFEELEKIYKNVIYHQKTYSLSNNSSGMLNHIEKIIEETKNYSLLNNLYYLRTQYPEFSFSSMVDLEKHLYDYRVIKNSQFYRLWRNYNDFRSYLKKFTIKQFRIKFKQITSRKFSY